MNLFHPAFRPTPSEIVGQSGEETAAPPISPPQDRTKCPGSHQPGVIVGQKRLYLTRMTHADENRPAGCGPKWGKASQPGCCCGVADAHDPRSGPCGRRAAGPGLTRMPHPRQTRASRRFPAPGTFVDFLELPLSVHRYSLSSVRAEQADASCCYRPSKVAA